MIITGIAMLLYGPIFKERINIVLTVFGLLGISFAIADLNSYRNRLKLQSNYLGMHLGKMIGGYIAAVTAFVVVNQVFPSFYGWFIPGIIGGFYIYWSKKISKKNILEEIA